VSARLFCAGADTLAHPSNGPTLVTCPECGRSDLNGEQQSIRDDDGERLLVPRHRESPRAKEWQMLRAKRANERQER